MSGVSCSLSVVTTDVQLSLDTVRVSNKTKRSVNYIGGANHSSTFAVYVFR